MLPDRVPAQRLGTILIMVGNDACKPALSCKVTVYSGISYSGMSSGTWTIILEAPEYDFTAQRQFNLTMGARNNNTVIVTVRSSISPGLVQGRTLAHFAR
jgi:hypothetical protein